MPPKEEELKKSRQQVKILEDKISDFRQRAQVARKKAHKIKRMSERIMKEYKLSVLLEKQYENEEADVDRQLTDSDALLNTFRKTIQIKQSKFQKQLESLKVLEESIGDRTAEVHHKIHTLHDAVYEWQTSIYLLNEHMRIAGYYLSDRFHIWHQTIPLLNSWFSSEEKVHHSIYNTSWLVGLHEEIRAMAEIYSQIQEYSDQYYDPLVTQYTAVLPPLKLINEQRQERSEVFDNMHVKLLRSLRQYVRQCDNMQTEIEERENIRVKLNNIAMELSSALEDDLTQSMEMCESECRRPIEFVLDRFRGLSDEDGIPKEDHRRMVAKTYVQQYLNAVQAQSATSPHYILAQQPAYPAAGGGGMNHPSIYDHNSLYQNHLQSTLRNTEYFYHDSQMDADQPQNIASYPIERIVKPNKHNPAFNNYGSVDAPVSAMSDLSDSYMDPSEHASMVSTNQVDLDDPNNIHQLMNKSRSNPSSPLGRANSTKSSPNPRMRHLKYPDPVPPPSVQQPISPVPAYSASPEALQMLSAFLEPFDNIKQSLSFSKTKKVNNNVRSEILRYIDHISPYIRGEWEALEDMTVDFVSFHGDEEEEAKAAGDDPADSNFKDSATYLRTKDVMERSNLENLLFAKFTLKDIQYNCATVSKEAISTVCQLLLKMKAKQDVFDQSYDAPYRDEEFDRKEYMTAKELIAKISHTLNENREVFEDWIVEYPASSYKQAKDSAESEIGKWDLQGAHAPVSPEKQKDDLFAITSSSVAKKKTSAGEGLLHSLLQTVRSPTPSPRQGSSRAKSRSKKQRSDGAGPETNRESDDETVNSVTKLLNLSEELLSNIHNEIEQVDKDNEHIAHPGHQTVLTHDKVVKGDIIPVDAIPESHVKDNFRPFYTMSEDEYEREEREAFALASALEHGSKLESSKQLSTVLTSTRSQLHSESNVLNHINSEGIVVSGFGEERDKELAKVEVIMKGDLFTMSLFWKAVPQEVMLVLRQVFDKTSYREYRMMLSMDILSEITETISEHIMPYIFKDSAKLCHHISTGLQIEIIDQMFYDEITTLMMKDNVQLEQDEVDIDITKYISLKKDRRVSVITPGQPQLNKRASFHQNAATAGLLRDFQNSNPLEHRPSTTDSFNFRYGYLLKVLVLRSKNGVLLKHSFPSLFIIEL